MASFSVQQEPRQREHPQAFDIQEDHKIYSKGFFDFSGFLASDSFLSSIFLIKLNIANN